MYVCICMYVGVTTIAVGYVACCVMRCVMCCVMCCVMRCVISYPRANHPLARPRATEEVQIDIEGEDVEESMLRHLFWQEVRHYHPDLPAQPGL